MRWPPRAEEVELGVEVEAIEHDGSSVTGVRTSAGTIAAGQVVVAAGPWSASLAPVGDGPRSGPVKGQILELRARGAMPSPFERVLRTPRCYLVSRGDGRVVLGATVEEQGFDTTVTADGVFRLLEAAWEVLPEVGELELVGARGGPPARNAGQRADGRPGGARRPDLGDRPLAERRAAGARSPATPVADAP